MHSQQDRGQGQPWQHQLSSRHLGTIPGPSSRRGSGLGRDSHRSKEHTDHGDTCPWA